MFTLLAQPIRRPLIFCLVVGAAFCAASPASAAKVPHSCWPKSSSTFLENREARVFYIGRDYRGTDNGERTTYLATSLVSCNKETRKWHFLYADPGDAATEPLAAKLAGHYVALDVIYTCAVECDADDGHSFIVTNVKSGRDYLLDANAYGVFMGGPSNFILGRFFLHPNGTVAYAVDRAGTRQVVRVKLAGSGRGRTVIDEGSGINLRSLALKGNTLSWTNAGTTKRAPFKL